MGREYALPARGSTHFWATGNRRLPILFLFGLSSPTLFNQKAKQLDVAFEELCQANPTSELRINSQFL